MLGRLNLLALKHDPIEYGAGLSMIFGASVVAALLTRHKKWKWLWHEYLTSVDHKKIGIMYLVVSAVMMIKGLIDAVMMRVQLALSVGDSFGYLGAEHYQQIFTAHGVTMIFFVGMGVIFGIMNIILPLQIGARDVAFPFLNSLSFWLFAAGAMQILVSLTVGVFAGTGWTAYPPLSGLKYSPGVGVDYWIWSVQISGIGTLLSGVNFLTTILKMRCPGMTLGRMPVFVWASSGTLILILASFPILTANVAMLTTDRLLETKLFTAGYGGNPMMYINLIWAWGHPEVYILVLPVFGVFSEFIPVFSRKKLFGYTSMVWAIMAITFLSFIVWLHHFFTMGAGANVNAFFGIMTMIIAIPTGVKVFNWIFTMCRGRVRFDTPMLWFIGFIVTFVTGGMTGVMMSLPAIDFQVHNTLFLVAHFHSVIIGGVLFGFFGGFTYWFPKIFGFRLDEKWGKRAFLCWFIGFLLAFMPLYILGFMGASRRLDHYEASTGWHPLFVIAGIGSFIIAAGAVAQCIRIIVSVRRREEYRDLTGDPWDGRTLEWSTTSPPPFYNFATIPKVHGRDPFWAMKHTDTTDTAGRSYETIHMPRNTGMGAYVGLLSFLGGFALVWHIFWLAASCSAGVIIALIIRLHTKHVHYHLDAKEVERIEHDAQRNKG
ncbi:MAG: cytochrome o ubiquinol oxidase subunit I [Simkaniaceae bacterium]|nr:cytochrome o ubiquinol oxidase subunit I [Simkaniaceae bacterium]